MRWLRRLSAGKVVIVAALVSLAVFLIWVAIIILVRLAFSAEPVSWDLWGMVEGLSSAAAFATVIGGGFVALLQLIESTDSRNLSVYNDIFEDMMADEEIEGRRWIYTQLPDDPGQGLETLSDEGRRYIKLVLNTFDRLGFLLKQDWVTGEAIVEWVSPMVVKVWAKLGPYVEYEAARRREPDYYSGAVYLAEKCGAWRKKYLPESQFEWLDDAL